MSRSPALLLGVAGASVALDQWSKYWATTHLAFREPVHVLDDLVRLTYTRNSGVAFGLGAGLPFPYWSFSVLAIGVILWMFVRHRVHGGTRQLALALIMGGAIGNLIDRVRFGEVTDFILLSWRRWQFPVFNVADSAVTTGVALFALDWPGHRRAAPAADAAPETGAGETPARTAGDDGIPSPATDDASHAATHGPGAA